MELMHYTDRSASGISMKLVFFLLIMSILSGSFSAYFTVQHINAKKVPVETSLINSIPLAENTRYVEESQTISAIETVKPSVISITASRNLRVLRNGEALVYQQKIGGGSGFIISADGMALTNHHVISDQSVSYSAVLSDGKEYAVEVIDSDASIDLAVLQLYEMNGSEKRKPTNLPAATLGDSDSIKVGQKVLAVGNALAQYENTVTSGIISATGREITAGDYRGNTEQLLGLIQTDAAINPGNSGGPLIDLEGRVIAVNVAIDRSANGIGFAIPVADVQPLIKSVQQHGKILRPYIGVRYIILNDRIAQDMHLSISQGALLLSDSGSPAIVPGSPADQIGLTEGDIITAIDGQPLTQKYTLIHAIRQKSVDEGIQLSVWRDGEMLIYKLTLAATVKE